MNQLHISWGGIITVLQSGNVKLAVILGDSAADPEGLGGRHEWPPPRKNDFFSPEVACFGKLHKWTAYSSTFTFYCNADNLCLKFWNVTKSAEGDICITNPHSKFWTVFVIYTHKDAKSGANTRRGQHAASFLLELRCSSLSLSHTTSVTHIIIVIINVVCFSYHF